MDRPRRAWVYRVLGLNWGIGFATGLKVQNLQPLLWFRV